jgi:peptide deformylase
VTYPDERLRAKTKLVSKVDDDIRRLVDDMAETMYTAPGVGLAANQVGVPKRVAVVDTEYTDAGPNLIVVINPEMMEKQGEITWEEGCLSFPEIREDVLRSERIRLRALNREGKPFELEAQGFLAVALQHEIDHLDGILLVDHVSFLKKRIINRQLAKRKKTG